VIGVSTPVAIVVAPAEAPPVSLRAMVEACSAAIRGYPSCEAAASTPDEAPVDVVVRWIDEKRGAVTVRVRLRRTEVVRERRLAFSAADPEIERWRAVGFAVATLIEDATAAPTPATPPTAATPATPPPAREEPLARAPRAPPPFPPFDEPAPLLSRDPRTAQTSQLSVGVAAKVLTSLGGLLVTGPEVRVATQVGAPYEATGAIGTTLLGGDRGQLQSGLTWFSAGLRAMLWTSPPMRYWLRAEVLVERLRLEARDLSLADSADQWQPGGLAAVGLDRRVGPIRLGAAVELGVRSGTTTVLVERTEAGHLRALRPALEVGGSYAF
jgi:hypothetical protein